MTCLSYGRLILLSGFSFLVIAGLPAYSDTIAQDVRADIKEPWNVDKKIWPPDGFQIQPARHLNSVVLNKDHLAPDSLDISIRAIETKMIELPPSFPPFPAMIDLPVTLDDSKETRSLHSTYIPGDTRHLPANIPEKGTFVIEVKESAILHNNQGVKLGYDGKWVEAIEEHKIALSAQPSNQAFITNLSSAELKYAEQLEHSGNISEAVKHYRDAIYTDRRNASADIALDRCSRLLRINRSDPVKCQELTDKLINEGDLEGAIVEYYGLIRLADTGSTRAAFGFLLLKADKVVDGYIQLKKAVGKTDWNTTENAKLAQCHRQLAELLQKYSDTATDSGRKTTGMQRMLNAWLEYERALFLQPADQECIRQLAFLSAEAVKIKPSYNNQLALGSAYLLHNELDKAKESYAICAKLEPHNPTLLKAETALKRARKAHIQN